MLKYFGDVLNYKLNLGKIQFCNIRFVFKRFQLINYYLNVEVEMVIVFMKKESKL